MGKSEEYQRLLKELELSKDRLRTYQELFSDCMENMRDIQLACQWSDKVSIQMFKTNQIINKIEKL